MEVLLTAQELAALLKISMRQLWRLRNHPSPYGHWRWWTDVTLVCGYDNKMG